MTEVFKAKTVGEAWLKGIAHLIGQPSHRAFNVVLDIETPTVYLAADKQVYNLVDTFLRLHGTSVETVSDTIFPAKLYKREGTSGVYDTYPNKVFPKIKANPNNWWGTYAHRLVHRMDHTGKIIQPLKRAIDRLKAEKKLPGPAQAHAAYEVNLCDAFEMDIALADASMKGHNKRYGGPCLSHLSFKLVDHEEVSMIAFYRSHYYIARAYGNLVGLSQLLKFVARESGLKAGFITCISSYAQIDTSPWGIAQVKALVSESKNTLGII